jgi:HSP20 family protein
MERFRDEMSHLFEGTPVGPIVGAGYPPLNVWETDEAVFVEAELPGLHLTDLDITISEADQLSIKGSRKPLEPEKAVWHSRERAVGEFHRTLKLPIAVDADKVVARFENGVLNITLPKSEKLKPRRIEVKGE